MVNASQIDGRMIWEYLSDAGLSCGVLNVPITYPPRQVNGYLVPGLLSPDQGKTTYPPDFLKPYEAELGPYRLTPRVQFKAGNEAEFIPDIADLIETQARYALRLMREVRLSTCPAGTPVPPFPKVPDPPMQVQLPDARWTDAWRAAANQLRGKHMWGGLAFEVGRVVHDILQHADRIKAYEAERAKRAPWLFQNA